MSDDIVLTKSLIKAKLLVWFAGYTVICRRHTPKAGSFGSIQYKTVWRLGKKVTRVRR